MESQHRFYFKNSSAMKEVESKSVNLVVTSPPYPMIEMWDGLFASQSKAIDKALKNKDRMMAFELMHRELDKIWDECYRVLCPGGFACINIGDATRTVNDHFMLYPNHSRILTYMMAKGMTPLPEIIWRKQSNAPNKFMGSGMLPAGAYVTQEHEYVLILRKGGKREFNTDQSKEHRRQSAFFWEERNFLFSDVWFDLLGTRQALADKDIRKRSAAYPFELPYRLITMYSLKGDTVLDPFFGIGTTMLAAMCAGRNSIGYELSPEFSSTIIDRTASIIALSKERIDARLSDHLCFVDERFKAEKPFKYLNHHYNFPVITAQEQGLLLNEPQTLTQTRDNAFEMTYAPGPQDAIVSQWKGFTLADPPPKTKVAKTKKKKDQPVQMEFFS